MNIKFKNTLLFDGSGSPAKPASVTVEGDQIVSVGPPDDSAAAPLEVDLHGLALCPGFIDTHSHSDLFIIENPMVPPKLRQGITTEVFGQDGISMAPLPLQYVAQWRKNIAGLEGTSDALSWDYKTTAGYLDLLERTGVGVNVCYLVPHGNVRMEAMGLGDNKASESTLEKMCSILQRELDGGGCGLSTGLIYPPCTYADLRELKALCRVAAKNAVPLVIHQRSEADAILESMREVIGIAEETGVHLHFSHFKICGKYNDTKYPEVIALLDGAKANGLQVTFDQYPYVAGSTMLSAILPPWAHAGGSEKMLARLSDPGIRLKIIEAVNTHPCDWDNFVAFAGTDGIFITSVQSAKSNYALGKSLTELAQIRNTDPITAAMDLILEEENGVSMVDFYGLEKHVKGFMLRQEMNVCTDGLMHGNPHPRTYAAFPRVLGHYTRSEQLLTMEEAVRKMTLQPATTFGINRRGKISEGWFADLVVFNPETIIDTATFTEPKIHPPGIELVMVNGLISFANDTFRESLPISKDPGGQILRRKR